MPSTILLASLAALTAGGAYAVACVVAPFGTCLFHRGARCRRCGGTGRRVRVGRRLYLYLAALHREVR